MTGDYTLGAVLEFLTVVAWVLARLYLHQPVLHPWLGAACSAFLSTLTVSLTVNPDLAPIAHIASNTTGLLTGYCFARGVRYEATGKPSPGFETIASIAGALAVALVTELTLPAPMLRGVIQFFTGLCFLVALFWVPTLVRRTKPRSIALAIVALVVGLGAILCTPLISYATTGQLSAHAYPNNKSIYVFMAACLLIFVLFSFNLDRRRRSHGPSVP
jgi:hypothetical protein